MLTSPPEAALIGCELNWVVVAASAFHEDEQLWIYSLQAEQLNRDSPSSDLRTLLQDSELSFSLVSGQTLRGASKQYELGCRDRFIFIDSRVFGRLSQGSQFSLICLCNCRNDD